MAILWKVIIRFLYRELMWKDIKGYEGLYQISDNGEVKSLARHVENGSKKGMMLKERILKLNYPSSQPYPQVTLNKNGSRENRYVHNLVAEAFLGENTKGTVNHKDGNKLNNCVDNLEYMTYQENNQHAYDTGLHGKNENHYKAKLTVEQVKEIKSLGKYSTYEDIATKYRVSGATIRDILVGNTWKNI